MEKRKRDPVVPEMRERLLANRDGEIMRGQWLDLIVQPLVILALLLAAVFLVFGEDMIAIIADIWWVVVPLIVLLVFVPVDLPRLSLRARAGAFRPPVCGRAALVGLLEADGLLHRRPTSWCAFPGGSRRAFRSRSTASTWSITSKNRRAKSCSASRPPTTRMPRRGCRARSLSARHSAARALILTKRIYDFQNSL